MNEKVTIDIRGRQLTIDAEGLTPLEVNALADYVSERIQQVQHAHPATADTSKLALLAALDLADELFRLRKQFDSEKELSEQKVDDMIASLRSATDASKGQVKK
ncbi:MAG: hypothetical protein A3G41_01205 [Elusimicrobia bacterium RIFCSPLOWO2_12_FULL_59_9]|nr:MAG: hypothetical protein A3G41_01205 [Elusimicrobia bacterium RIFCSPLOWO2_12_FULL_59_9]